MFLLEPENWTLLQAMLVFAGCASVIAVAGTWITGVVDQLADRTRIGEAAAGAVLLGASTSLGGSVLSVTAAWNGHAELAVSNALGGIAVQTFFLGVADMVYRRANLEHAAASLPNMMQNGLLICLLSLILLSPYLPDYTIGGVHPVTPVMLGVYAYGLYLVRRTSEQPMWRPSMTRDTREDKPDDANTRLSLTKLWLRFLVLMIILGVSGWALEPAATVIASKANLTQTLVGVLFTAVSTSIPELVTSVAAVRRGALTLAVSGIIGGNAFDTLFTAASDIAYREGSIYHALPESSMFWAALTLLMSGVLMMGLIRRERHGIGQIGMESVVIMVLYVFGVALLLW